MVVFSMSEYMDGYVIAIIAATGGRQSGKWLVNRKLLFCDPEHFPKGFVLML